MTKKAKEIRAAYDKLKCIIRRRSPEADHTGGNIESFRAARTGEAAARQAVEMFTEILKEEEPA